MRGCQRKIIQVKNPGGMFAEAYFILRDGGEGGHTEDDMVREANRIIAESRLDIKKSRRARLRRYYPFFCGAASAAVLTSLVWLALR